MTAALLIVLGCNTFDTLGCMDVLQPLARRPSRVKAVAGVADLELWKLLGRMQPTTLVTRVVAVMRAPASRP